MSSMPTPRDTAWRGSQWSVETARQSIGLKACLDRARAASAKRGPRRPHSRIDNNDFA